ncbi:MAG: discoidin domain-containing protein [Candidatus Azobacteroides sp.]|nr:discoidin domain-containing protein [Candidatus Azobacteroides sp.]
MNKNFTKTRSWFFAICITMSSLLYAQTPDWKLIQPKYETADAFVAGFNVMDYGADNTGQTDQTELFQSLLEKLGTLHENTGSGNGGILYIPEGKYLLEGRLYIPKGVTIRGDWEKPVKGQPIKGTILMPTYGRGSDAEFRAIYELESFITMQPSSAVKDVNIWYPDQDPDNIVPYPPAILSGYQGHWGNDYTLVANVTLVNAYDGVIFSRRNGGGAPNYYGIYGSPLRRGIEIDNIAEVGRIDNVDFSPDYWAGSGLPGAPSVDGKHKKFIYENATGIVMRRNDWSFACKANIEGYRIGYRLDLSFNPDSDGNYTSPNGHNYGMEFTDCRYGVYVAAVSGAGMMFYEYKFNNCDFGFYLEKNPEGILQLQGCEFNTNQASLYAPTTNKTKILMNQCTINKGPVDIRGGLSSIVNCDFNNAPDQIILGPSARVSITGNRFKEEASIRNASMYDCIIDHTPVEMTELPHFPYVNQFDIAQKPTGTAYYLATAHGVSTTADDNSNALQILLDKVKAEGGGVVFLPPGHYNFRNPITIPGGVELKGACDVPSVPTGPGTALEIYAGKDDENGTPFITMERGSGIRGLVMNYPEQVVQLLTEPELNGGDIYKYPYTIRGNADVYIVNIGFRACYHGIDLFTNKCDNHFVDYPAGHVFKTGIRVGGGSKDGRIYNAQFNQIAYGSGGETKFGAWPNSPDNTQPDNAKYRREHTAAYAYCWNNLDFLVLEDCENQILYNNFDFGSNRGVVLSVEKGKGPTGISLGQGIDAGMKAFFIGGVGEDGFNFINTQIVTTAGNDDVSSVYQENNRYIQADYTFDGKVTFFAADFWGQPKNISNDILNGTIELQAGNYSNPGGGAFVAIGTAGTFELTGSNVNNTSNLMEDASSPQAFIQSSMLNAGRVNTAECGLWLNNLALSGSVSSDAGAFIDRTGWIATASVYNEDAQNALDYNSTTRWSTSFARQEPGQWFMVDMRTEKTFTGIYMDSGDNNNYFASSFVVYISTDAVTWTQVGSGMNTPEVNFEVQNARYIKVEQTGTSSTAWRIAEFYVLDTYLDTYVTGIKDVNPEAKADVNSWFSNGQLYVSGTQGTSTINIHTLSGQQITAPKVIEDTVSLDLASGIYIVTIQNNGNVYRKKILVK